MDNKGWSDATGIKWLDDAAASIKAEAKKVSNGTKAPVSDVVVIPEESEITVAGIHPMTLIISIVAIGLLTVGSIYIYKKIKK